MNQEDAFTIANEGRNSISSFCINSCAAKCCKFGSLLLQSENEISAIIDKERVYYTKKEIIKPTAQGNFTFTYEKNEGPCPKLTQDNLCSIHKNPNRPKICGDFPLFVFKGYVSIAREFCPASKEGLLDSYVERIKLLGFKEI